jgi:2-polyprenyl-6-methoxyphenol hydroxylase-like FAD-dependent oxidoreductase
VEVADVVVVGAVRRGRPRRRPSPAAAAPSCSPTRRRSPRDKCCGDGLTTLALRELEALGARPGTVPNWFDVDAAWLRSPSGREVCVPLPEAQGLFAATAPRSELDASLVALARRAGVDVREGCAIAAVAQDDDVVDVTFDGGSIVRARYVVAADGMWSPTRKLLGAAQPGTSGSGMRSASTRDTSPAQRATDSSCGSKRISCPATCGASRCRVAA